MLFLNRVRCRCKKGVWARRAAAPGTRSSRSPGCPLDRFAISPCPWALGNLFLTNYGPGGSNPTPPLQLVTPFILEAPSRGLSCWYDLEAPIIRRVRNLLRTVWV